MAAPAMTPANASALIKHYYKDNVVDSTISQKASMGFLALKRHPDVDGDFYVGPMVVGDVPSGSPDFATAQAAGNSQPLTAVQFSVPPKQIASTFTISDTMILQTRTKKGGWMQALRQASDSAFRTAAFKLSVAFVGSGWGNVGTISNASMATSVITLGTKSDVNKIQLWDQVQLAATVTADAARNAGAIGYIKSVDYAAGTVVVAASFGGVAANISAIWAAAAQNDVIFLAGWRDFTKTDGLSASMVAPHGLKALIPDVNSRPVAGEVFDAVDRSQSPIFLAGSAIDGTTGALQDKLLDAVMAVQQYGGATDVSILCSPKRYNDIVKSTQGQSRYDTLKGRGLIGFKTLYITTNGIEAKVIADRFLSDSECYVYDQKAVVFISWGPAPAVVEHDGLSIIRLATALGYEGRILSLCNFTLDLPAATCNVLLPTS